MRFGVLKPRVKRHSSDVADAATKAPAELPDGAYAGAGHCIRY